jgi:hypothetical protein
VPYRVDYRNDRFEQEIQRLAAQSEIEWARHKRKSERVAVVVFVLVGAMIASVVLFAIALKLDEIVSPIFRHMFGGG